MNIVLTAKILFAVFTAVAGGLTWKVFWNSLNTLEVFIWLLSIFVVAVTAGFIW